MGRICRVVPKEWIQYEAVGNVIPNTRFLVFKAPLCARLLRRIPAENHFTLINLFHKVGRMGLSLGLVVDLTDTDRYYDQSDIAGMGIEHEKINCPGRGFLERDDLVETFITVVDNFLEANADNDTIIGVHCTDGVNRSGYLVCRFLVDRLGWSSHEAIDAFETARGYRIGRGAYVQAVHRAAKERRLRKRLRQSEEVASSEESESQRQSLRRKEKHKKRRRVGVDEEIIEPDMQAVFNHIALAFERHESGFEIVENSNFSEGETSMKPNQMQQQIHSMPLSHGSMYISAENSPFVGSSGTAEQDDEDDDVDSSAQDNAKLGEDNNDIGEANLSKKKREKKARLQKQFDMMKTGSFWKINELQKEKFAGRS